MTVKDFAEKSSFGVLCMPSPDREIEGVYIGDLLSWVMGRAESGEAWITIMSNINIVAVATLSDVSCVILSEGVRLEAEVLSTAASKGINILCTELSSYDAAVKIHGII